MLTRSPIRKKRSKPRRGRVFDKDYVAWIHTLPCAVSRRSWAVCRGPVTAHHVRSFGSPKNDRHAIPLCQGHHLHDYGPTSIERIGKARFEEIFALDLVALVNEYLERYQGESAA
jgi:hypothetical protein